MKNTITGVIITKNEERNITETISELSFCDEVIVCDNVSTDGTLKLARKTKAIVISKKFESYSDQRNYALDKATGDWVFFLDADERVSENLQKEIIEFVGNSRKDALKFKRDDCFLGQKILHGENATVTLLRLAKRDSGVWKRDVHEYWDVTGTFDTAKYPIKHYSPKNISSYIEKLNNFAKIHSQENLKEGKNPSLVFVIFIPFLKFIDDYILKLGFLDGVAGFVIAVSMSLHSFLSWSTMYFSKNNE